MAFGRAIETDNFALATQYSALKNIEMTIELDVTNLSREGLVTSRSMVISTNMIVLERRKLLALLLRIWNRMVMLQLF